MATTSTRNYQGASPEDWKERGAASLIKTETDENGKVSMRVIKKGVQDFDFGRNLGIGSYSTVVGATDKQTLRSYAIKILDKRHIIKEKKVKYVDIEKHTLNRLGDHPGIIKLYYTFQDESSLYFVLDYASNGELLTLIKKMGSLDEECSKYYGAQILDAVEFMHSKGVVHRDLKPENILLDDRMRIKITDFGTAKLLTKEVDANGNKLKTFPKDIRASSFVGTAEYVSPELLAEKYQGKPCDIWAFGCIIYQLIAGRPPFKAANEYLTFQKIIKLQYSYPPGFPFNTRDLLKHVLLLDPNSRWTIPKIKSHVFFEGVDWNRQAIWKSKPPRIQPYRGPVRSTSNPVVKIPAPRSAGSSSTNVRKNLTTSQRSASAGNLLRTAGPSVPTQENNPYVNGSNNSRAVRKVMVQASASTAAAVALAKPPSTISPYYTPTQHTSQPPAPARTQPRTQVSLPPRPQINIRSRTQPILSSESSKHLSQVKPAASPKPAGYPLKPLETRSNQQGGFGDVPISPMELPPQSAVDLEFSAVVSKQERILRIGSVIMSTTSSGNAPPEPIAEKEQGKFSKLFSGSRKKKRLLIVTSSGRLLVVADGGDRKQLHHDITISSPQVTIREFPFNRKAGVGLFSVETHNKIHTVEDPSGSADWMAAFNRAKEFVYNAEAVASSKTHNAAAAAAMAAASAAGGRTAPNFSGPSGAGATAGAGSGGGGGVESSGWGSYGAPAGSASGGHGSSPIMTGTSARGGPGPTTTTTTTTTTAIPSLSTSSFGRRSSDFDYVANTAASTMLQRNEERKMIRRGQLQSTFNA